MPFASGKKRRRTPQKRETETVEVEIILRYASLASAGRNTVFGTEQVLKEVRRGGSRICVLLSSDASERTVKQISDKCAFYGTALIRLPVDMETLAKRCGKVSPCAALAVTSTSLAKEIIKAAQQ